MPRATERVLKKEHPGRIGQVICSSIPIFLPEQLKPVSNSEDILPRKALLLSKCHGLLMSKYCIEFDNCITIKSSRKIFTTIYQV